MTVTESVCRTQRFRMPTYSPVYEDLRNTPRTTLSTVPILSNVLQPLRQQSLSPPLALEDLILTPNPVNHLHQLLTVETILILRIKIVIALYLLILDALLWWSRLLTIFIVEPSLSLVVTRFRNYPFSSAIRLGQSPQERRGDVRHSRYELLKPLLLIAGHKALCMYMQSY